MKQCSQCEEVKAVELFTRRSASRDGLAARCKQCVKEYRTANQELLAKKGRAYRLANRDRIAAKNARWGREKMHGLAAGEYERRLAEQDGRCAICRETCSVNTRLSIDHDHACCAGTRSCGNCVRGLLCHNCNVGANWDTVPDWPAKAAAYLATYGG